MSQVGNLRIFACGGAGINLASAFDQSAGRVEEGHCAPHLVYVDTSRSNLSENINQEHIALIEDVDGSGKVRRENSDKISRNIKAIIQKFAPMDFNIVVFSASGGSGSVFGPLIISELLQRDQSVVAVVVGSDESNITATNTINTLKSLEAIAQKTNAPVVIHYSHNNADTPRSSIDRECRMVIGAISMLASRQNAELDSRDIGNWVRFDRSTTAKAQLAMLDIYRDRKEAEVEATDAISIASLFNSTDAPPLNLVPEYHCAGYPIHKIADANGKVEDSAEIHYVITLDDVHQIAKMINHRVAELEQKRKARVQHGSILGDTEIDDTGLVF